MQQGKAQLDQHQRDVLGKKGENIAARWLAARGHTLLARNVRYPVGEIDIITSDPQGNTVFVEVKTRSTTAFGSVESITRAKMHRLRKAAALWLKENPCQSIRFDALIIQMGRHQDLKVDYYQGVE
ncbi:YraN family protein [Corynebacterium sp. 153RC1]|uniref:YraN family protein n=1 Tax=Corynebacterium TaxID=1716 RepID=UPI00211C4FF5|nr:MULTISPECIES: YraN family protein [unclassified Corynebacterium]MCQ9371446.1 YraN family protein [Corynebacterium sp. 35RC1]MCQ9342374.1 YraN family protein [Corynebacterium sp. 76QC2CO]MCQ9351637.1 YraN family protein [Corynebacterium sp. 209RC1]MCQ9354006.1 YraN family protein [Corynebacterium sp. 1222RC1]MCQ9355920.1 YraN family protein [Corynebacterium sp. 122RC1]